jgi:hypothetical protein
LSSALKRQKVSNENEQQQQHVAKSAFGEATMQLEALVSEDGLNETHLLHLSNIIQRNDDERWSRMALSRLLIPRRHVPIDALVQLLGAFGNFSMPLRLSVLKWLIVVFDLVTDAERMRSLYGVFFHYLGYESLR